MKSHYQFAVYMLTRRYGVQPTEARFDDLVQEAVIAAWRALQTPRTDPNTYAKVVIKRELGHRLARPQLSYTGSKSPDRKVYELTGQDGRRGTLLEAEKIGVEATELAEAELLAALEPLDDEDREILMLLAAGYAVPAVAKMTHHSASTIREQVRELRPIVLELLRDAA